MWLLAESRRPLRAHRTNPASATYRLASSIKLPWGIGLAALLILAVATAVLVGRVGESTLRVPQALLDYQEQITRDAGESVRRSLNASVSDLDQLAGVLSSGRATDPTRLRASLADFARGHKRYRSVFAIDRRGAVLALAGLRPPPDVLARPLGGRVPIREVARTSGKEPLILHVAPVTAGRSRAWALIGIYDPSFMQFPLDVSRPGYAWVVNRTGQMVGARAARPRLAPLPSLRLRQAAARAVSAFSGAESVGGSVESQEVVGYAPVAGRGPAGRLGWGVVTTRSLSSFALPQTEARRQGLLVGAMLAVITILVFGWLYIVVLSPTIRLQREAERLAYGDLSKGVDVIRYDEIGLIGRALERMRIGMIRSRVKSSAQTVSGNGKPKRPRPTSKVP